LRKNFFDALCGQHGGRLLAQPPLDPKGTSSLLDLFPARMHGTAGWLSAVGAGQATRYRNYII